MLLLDDLWEEVRLSEIGIPVLESGQYRVVFTTRSEDVCGSMGAIEKIKVELLGNTDAWDLFKATARSSELSNEISDVAKEIAANCHGLPLALKVIGKTMASKTTLDEWSRALDTLKDDPGELKGTENEFIKF